MKKILIVEDESVLLNVLKEVRENLELRDLPIVVLSNFGADEDIKKALSLGANDYFVKTQHPIGEILEKAETYIFEEEVNAKPAMAEGY